MLYHAKVLCAVCVCTQRLSKAAAFVPTMKRCGEHGASDSLKCVTGEQCTN